MFHVKQSPEIGRLGIAENRAIDLIFLDFA